MTTDDLWFVTLTEDWCWLRRAWYVLTWPLWFAWARLRMRWYRAWHIDESRWWERLDD